MTSIWIVCVGISQQFQSCIHADCCRFLYIRFSLILSIYLESLKLQFLLFCYGKFGEKVLCDYDALLLQQTTLSPVSVYALPRIGMPLDMRLVSGVNKFIVFMWKAYIVLCVMWHIVFGRAFSYKSLQLFLYENHSLLNKQSENNKKQQQHNRN